ncbi:MULTISPECIES: hypothetical protein [unclassified Nocardioides]|uniref:hypothetical protein n=1 Tax=unclassified Nocardioides TaxID=2615069 RepID=UPI0000EB6035|nr:MULTISPECIES: hypothetical protein [unclassified Nocardioides]ABL79808.1 hypothetical protein Noca_0263 [Nocardioides sp. JS614]
MAAYGDRLLIGAGSDGGRLTVFEKVGDGPFRVLARSRAVHDFDVAYSGREPVLAWSRGRLRQLSLVVGGRLVNTRTPTEAVALATDGRLVHVVFSTVARTTCGPAGCLHSGVYHVGLRGRRVAIKASLVQAGSSSPFRLAADTSGRTLGVVVSRNGVTRLYQRSF